MDSGFFKYRTILDHSQLILGTAQLGMDYGIANKTGKPDMQMAHDILRTAWEGGIRQFDTAQAYGESEKILGKVLSDLGILNQAKLITKLAPDINHSNNQDIADALMKSLENLKIERLYGLMLHHEEFLDLFEGGLSDILADFIDQGLVDNIGMSLYSPAKAKVALEYDLISILQVPANICDHRFYETGIFHLAEKKGIHMYIRSIFLQGLLLMGKNEIPEKMKYSASIVEILESLCKEFNISRQVLTLGYIKQKYPQAFVIIGAETKEQLADNIAVWNSDQALSITGKVDAIFADMDEKIINPTLWPH